MVKRLKVSNISFWHIGKNKGDHLGLDIIQTSLVGYEFYSLLERWRVYRDELMKDDIMSTGIKEKQSKKHSV